MYIYIYIYVYIYIYMYIYTYIYIVANFFPPCITSRPRALPPEGGRRRKEGGGGGGGEGAPVRKWGTWREGAHHKTRRMKAWL